MPCSQRQSNVRKMTSSWKLASETHVNVYRRKSVSFTSGPSQICMLHLFKVQKFQKFKFKFKNFVYDVNTFSPLTVGSICIQPPCYHHSCNVKSTIIKAHTSLCISWPVVRLPSWHAAKVNSMQYTTHIGRIWPLQPTQKSDIQVECRLPASMDSPGQSCMCYRPSVL